MGSNSFAPSFTFFMLHEKEDIRRNSGVCGEKALPINLRIRHLSALEVFPLTLQKHCFLSWSRSCSEEKTICLCSLVHNCCRGTELLMWVLLDRLPARSSYCCCCLLLALAADSADSAAAAAAACSSVLLLTKCCAPILSGVV